ncbi:MAG: FG-GAP-like repeat-containing protein [Pyrinomonadaceae bacterium]
MSGITGNIALQPDGKIIILGNFFGGVSNYPTNSYIKRVNADGTIDPSFNCSACDSFLLKNASVQPDGKIVIAGYLPSPTQNYVADIIRVNADGSTDASFTSPFAPTGGDSSSSAVVEAIQPDGKILVKRTVSSGGRANDFLHRLNSDGSFDISFTEIVTSSRTYMSRVYLLPDGKILIGGGVAFTISNAYLYRYNSDGTRDNTFEAPTFTYPKFSGTSISDFDVQPDGSIIAAGRFSTVNGVNSPGVVRLLPAGNVDSDFSPAVSGDRVKILSNGQFILSFTNTIETRFYRLNSNGSLDNTYNSPAYLENIENWTIDGSNRVLSFGELSNELRYRRLNSDGSLDTSFNPAPGVKGIVTDIAIQPSGKLLVGGDFNRINGVFRNKIAVLNPDGNLDTTFDPGSGLNGTPNVFALQSDGKILVGGGFTTYNGVARNHIARLNSDGSLDNTFNPDVSSAVLSIILLADGKFLIGGSFSSVNGINQSALAKLNADGGLDTSFSPIFGSGTVNPVLVQPDGKIVVGGTFNGVNGFNRQNFARLNSDGTLDTTFNAGTISSVRRIIRQTDGKYLALTATTLTRRNIDGSADGSFQSATFTGSAATMFQSPDENIIVGGTFSAVNGTAGKNFVRFTSNGTLDLLFFPTGADSTVYDIASQADGKILVGGDFSVIGNAARPSLARITLVPHLRAPFDFDGDGKTDISIFRPSAGEWWYSRSSDSGNYAAQFGNSADKLVPGDYTGDGRADIAVFRPVSGEWFILRSEDGSYYSYPFGTNGDIPAIGDFDGDGKADSVVFRPSDTTWYIRRSSDGGFTIQQFGANGDVPAVADYDGDGKADIAIWRASVGEWWIQQSSNNSVVAFQFGNSLDKPVQGDYTGDGKADVAIYRPSSGEWLILRSNDFSYYSFPFGTNGDVPAPGDYDGDGRFDATVFRPSQSTWYVQRTTAGTLIQTFGQSGDVPVPNAFVP